MKNKSELGLKGRKLLAVLVSEIKRGRFKPGQPESFISYSEALGKLGVSFTVRAGKRLQMEGLSELDEWTKSDPRIPKITGLIIDKRRKRPGGGFAPSHGHTEQDWEGWWLSEAGRAIAFEHWDWYLGEANDPGSGERSDIILREEASHFDYRKVITIEPGKRGGKPCIRGMRITVGDVLAWLAAGMSHEEIRSDFPEITDTDIRACLAFAAEKESHAVFLPA